MANSARQITGGFYNSQALTSVSCTGQFGSNTVSGNLLIAICTASVGNNGSAVTPSLNAPSTPGFSWTLAGTITNTTPYDDAGFFFEIVEAIYYIAGAA